jgi:hypothetical protein
LRHSKPSAARPDNPDFACKEQVKYRSGILRFALSAAAAVRHREQVIEDT